MVTRMWSKCFVEGIDVNPTVNDDNEDMDDYEDMEDMWRHYTPVLVAIMNGHKKVVEMLLVIAKNDVNLANYDPL